MVCGRGPVQVEGREVGCEVHDRFKVLSVDFETEFGYESSSAGE